MNTSNNHTAGREIDPTSQSKLEPKSELPISQNLGKIITKLNHAQLWPLTYESSLTASIVQKIINFLRFEVSQETQKTLIQILQQSCNSPHLILTNHKTYINIALIQSYLYTILQQQEKNLTTSPSQRHTIVWPRVTYDPVFSTIGRSLSHLLQTIPQTASIELAFEQLKWQGYTEKEINAFKSSCLLTFWRQRNTVLSNPWLIFLAPSGTSEPSDKQGKIILAGDQELPGSMKLIQHYAKRWWSATIITTDENFETQQVIIHTHALTNRWLQDLLDNKWVMQTIADTAGWTVKDQQTITRMKEQWNIYPLPINQILQLFAS